MKRPKDYVTALVRSVKQALVYVIALYIEELS